MEIQEVQIVHMLTFHLHCTNGHQLVNFLVAVRCPTSVGSAVKTLACQTATFPVAIDSSSSRWCCSLQQGQFLWLFSASCSLHLQSIEANSSYTALLVVHGFARFLGRQHSMLRTSSAHKKFSLHLETRRCEANTQQQLTFDHGKVFW